MSTPLVAIVGRPNVGKSTLFNRLTRSRAAIVEDEPGVTRDRHDGVFELDDAEVRLCDTGGFVPAEEGEALIAEVRASAEAAIADADAVLWLTSVRDDITPADEALADALRRSGKPTLVLVNKCDSDRHEDAAMVFWALGFSELFPVSAEHGRGLGDVMDALSALLRRGGWRPEERPVAPVDPEAEAALEALRGQRGGYVEQVRMAVVGRPNVGKSTLINALLGSDRVLASDLPGTTRDAIDVELRWGERTYTLVDTAGMRRKSRIQERVEVHAVGRAVRAIERSHVAVLVLDATQELADQDARIAALIERRNRAVCLVINKWDAVEKDGRTMKAYELDLAERLPQLAHAPRVFISARTGQRVDQVMAVAQRAFDAFTRIIATSALNRWLEQAQAVRQPPVYKNKRIKLYFAAQTATRPPRIEIQVNTPNLSPSYARYLINSLRERFDLGGTPLRLSYVLRRARRSEAAAPPGERPPMVPFVDLDAAPLSDDEAPASWLDDPEWADDDQPAEGGAFEVSTGDDDDLDDWPDEDDLS